MPQIQVAHKLQKITKNISCQSFIQLNQKISNQFCIDVCNIKYVKPPIKDQNTFHKLKDKDKIVISGANLKQKSKAQLQKQKNVMQKIEILQKQQKIRMQQLDLYQQKHKSKQRGIQYFDTQEKMFIDLGIQYALCPLHLLIRVPQFKTYCINYKDKCAKVEGLLLQQLRVMFLQLDKPKIKKSNINQIKNQQNFSAIMQLSENSNLKKSQTQNSFTQNYNILKEHSNISFFNEDNESDISAAPIKQYVCPLEWISAWLLYCSQQIQIPFPTLDFNYFLNKTFQKVKQVHSYQYFLHDTDQIQQKSIVQQLFGMVVKIKQNYTFFNQGDQLSQRQQCTKYLLECDISRSQLQSVISGIKQGFKQKKVWRDFIYQVKQIFQTIQYIKTLPKYMFIHLNRFGYEQNQQTYGNIKLSHKRKSYHKVKISKIMHFTELLSPSSKQFPQWKQQKDSFILFNNEQFKLFVEQCQSKGQFSKEELQEMYKDEVQYDQFIRQQGQNKVYKGNSVKAKYILVGVVLHMGNFYHQWNDQHQHDCRGDFQTMVHDSGTRWLKFHRSKVEQILLQQVNHHKYWGTQSQWTPILLMYKQT